MSELTERIVALSPKQRKLLEQRLKQQGLQLSTIHILPHHAEHEAIPLSFAQQRLWFLEQLNPQTSAYNIPVAMRLIGPLNVTVLERSLAEIVRRHAILRTTFAVVAGRPAQSIAPTLTLTLPVVDLRELPATESQARAEQLATEETQRPFDLVRGPLLRTTLLWVGEEEYVVVLVMHHIVSDGWSMGVFARELATLYQDFSAGKPASLPDLSIQYADFARWQRQWLQGPVLEAQLSYWKQRLSGSLPVLALPSDLPRPAVQTFRGARQSLELPQTLTDALKMLSQRERVTLFTTLLTAFTVLLLRYTGEEDIVVGSPIANRNQSAIEGLIGFFVNIVVLRTYLGGNPTFLALLRQVRETVLGAYDHQDVPFEMLVEALQPERDLSRQPLFQVMFVLQNAPSSIPHLSGLRLDCMEVDSGTSKFDLTLSMVDSGRGLIGTFEYNTDLFNVVTMARMAQHFQMLLEGIVAHPEQHLGALPLLTEAERRQLLLEWNETPQLPLQAQGIHELLEAPAEQRPDAIAVVAEDQQLSYRELHRQAGELAQGLQALGVGPEVRVGLQVERSLALVVGVLGILKAGGAYVPLDPTYPPARLTWMMADAQLAVLVTDTPPAPGLPAPPPPGLWLCPLGTAPAPLAPGGTVPHDALAYVIYTSGSTGQPKGVLVPHRGLSNLVAAQQCTFGLHSGHRILQFASLSFDASIFEILMALGSGACLCLGTAAALRPGPALQQVLEQQAITHATLPPAALGALPAATYPALETLIVAGEACAAALVAQWAPGRRFFNAYGPTETTVWATVAACTPQARPPALGRPIANTQVYVLDGCLQPVPRGGVGQVYIGGVGLARGYAGQAAGTAARFVPHPYSAAPGARLYQSGDLARYGVDGELEFVGRRDQQVKLHGYRIELGEIEAWLGQQPGVQEAVVVVREGAEQGPRLVAYVVAQRGKQLTVAGLRTALQGQVPAYMVPATWVVLDTVPRTPNGKLDRHKLPAPNTARPALAEAFVAPRTPVEELVAGIWAHVLNIDQVGIHDSFFELGGHSLLATQLASRLRHACQVELPLRCLFETPTVAGLAERIEMARREEQGLQVPLISPMPRAEALPLSYAQQRLWFLDQLLPNTSLFTMPIAFRLLGPLNMVALERSLTEIIRRHEVLRTTFSSTDGHPIQTICPSLASTLMVVDLGQLAEVERAAQALQLASMEAQRPFDLRQGPLIRSSLLRLSETEHVVLLTLHHIISDGWSMGVLTREVAALYAAFSSGKPSPLPALPIQYADFAHWQRQWLQGAVVERQLNYWRRQLDSSFPVLELPTDHPRPTALTFRTAKRSLALPRTLAEALHRLSHREGVTLFMTLLAALQTLLYHITRQEDIRVGTLIANRHHGQTEGLIGLFVNTLILRTDLSGNPTFQELLRRVREVALEAYAHQDLPFEELVQVLARERKFSRSALFQVMFIFQNAPAHPLALPGLMMKPLRDEAEIFDMDFTATTFDLIIEVEEGKEGVCIHMKYKNDLFEPTTIERILRSFQSLLESIVLRSEERLLALLP